MAGLVRIHHPGGGKDAAASALATRQHGVVSRGQLLALGLTARAIEHRLNAGWLHPLHRGVYAVGHRRVSGDGRSMAAVLACGCGALLSHRSGGALWGFRQSTRASHDVIVPRRGGGRPGITLHSVRNRHPDDRAEVAGIPVTSVARTLLDLCDVIRTHQAERAFEDATRLRLLDMRAAQRLVESCSGGRGRGLFARLVAEAAEPPPTRSELERAFLELIRAYGLPLPLVNAMVKGIEVDAYWPNAKVAVELDGYAFHNTRRQLERDREREAILDVARIHVIRLTWSMIHDRPAQTAARVRDALARA
jgi:hypothetical protein